MNILAIDNDPIFLKFVEKFLIEEGHTVVTAPDGLSALDVLKSFSPDIVLIDYVMPNIDGKAFCHLLRNDSRYKTVYIVLLSAIAAEEWTDLKNIGADACIAKGPLNNMKGYVLDVLRDPAAAAKYCTDGNIIGLEDVYPRLITKELLESRNHLQLLLESMSEGILELNADNRVVFVNPAAEKILDQSGDSILGCLLGDLLPSNQKGTVAELLSGRKHSGKQGRPACLIEDDHQCITMQVIPLMPKDNHSLVILNDTTQQKKAEANLAKSEARYRQIFKIAPAGIYEVDFRSGRLTSVNDAICEYSGYTRAELLAMSTLDLLTPASQQKFIARVEKMANGEIVEETVEYTAVRKDGSQFIMSLNASYTYAGHTPVGATVVAHDVTERKNAETAVRESERRFRLLSELAEEGVVIHENGVIVDANEAVARIFEYEASKIIGISVEDLVTPDSWKAISEKIAAGSANRYEGVGVKKGGATFHCFMAGRSYQYSGKSLRVATFRDISARKKLETQLYQAQKMKALGTLAGGVAHDFNNLLMGIQGRTSIMRMKVESSSPILEHLLGIEESIQSAAALTQQLLGFARGGKYEIITIDLNDFVKKQSRLFGRTRKDITIHEDFEAGLWSIEADRGQMEQVLLNLLVNAWQAMPGGGALFIQSGNCIIDENQAQAHDISPGKFVRLSIRDTGIGMDAEVLERIFDPFFTTKEIGRGTGLGLASAYGIIHNHGGFIEVSTEESKGSTFSICLPAVEKTVSTEMAADESFIRGSETLLLVDDEKVILDVGREILGILGYEVLVATSGKEALEIYRNKADKIDMVILDMIMPTMDGREIYKHLKAINSEVRVLLSSGYSINGEAAKILELGCDGFIQKPFSMGDLSAKIREILNGD